MSIGLVTLALLTGLSADGFSQIEKGNVYFKQKVKVPYGLQDGSTVLKPGEYMLKIQSERG